jgi:hypothetical protein
MFSADGAIGQRAEKRTIWTRKMKGTNLVTPRERV